MNHDTDVVEIPPVNESPSTGGVAEKETSGEVLKSRPSTTLAVTQSYDYHSRTAHSSLQIWVDHTYFAECL